MQDAAVIAVILGRLASGDPSEHKGRCGLHAIVAPSHVPSLLEEPTNLAVPHVQLVVGEVGPKLSIGKPDRHLELRVLTEAMDDLFLGIFVIFGTDGV